MLLQQAGREDLLRVRRLAHLEITVDGSLRMLRDQAPLHRGNLELPEGYSFEDLLQSLNERIFFWPGSEDKPIDYGQRHFERCEPQRPVILKVGLQSLLAANPSVEPEFCRYNSGSPRCSGGKRSPRGFNTFLPASQFEGTSADVVEVTFTEPVRLPSDALVGDRPIGPWKGLFS
ncbi:MAG: hypothetical protein WDO18_20090 [Acidobacteriota bacterium]